MTVEQDQHSNALNALVELYTIDAQLLGGSIWYLTPTQVETPVIWKGNTYTSFPIQMQGAKHQMNGSLPRPLITISNVDGLLLAPIIALGDLVGAEVTLEKTFEQYLDNGSAPNPNTALPIERFLISQKTQHTKDFVSFELISKLSRRTLKLPRRQVLREAFPGVGNYRLRQ